MNQVNSTKLVQFHSKEKNIIGISHRDEINNKNLPRHKHKTRYSLKRSYKMSLDVLVQLFVCSSVSVHFTSLSGTCITEPVLPRPNNIKTRISIQIFLFLCQIRRKYDSRDYTKQKLTKGRVPRDYSHRFYEVKF